MFRASDVLCMFPPSISLSLCSEIRAAGFHFVLLVLRILNRTDMLKKVEFMHETYRARDKDISG
jgi:hypothetical protein